jgi:hypothetical protein
MKTNIRIILLVFIFSALINRCHAQDHKLKSVKVEIVDLDIETDADVSCEAFAYTFKDGKKIKEFNSEQDLSKFKLLIKDFKPVKTRSIDVRGTFAYSYEKTTDKYCFDKFGYFYANGRFYFNKELLIYILDKMYIYRNPKYLDTLRQQ